MRCEPSASVIVPRVANSITRPSSYSKSVVWTLGVSCEVSPFS